MEKKILYLDQKRIHRKAKNQFSKLIFENRIEYCSDPVSAINLLYQQEFDLLITDYEMPNLSGDEFIYCLKLIKNPDLPVISFSLDEGLNEGMAVESNVIATFTKDYDKLVIFLNENYSKLKEMIKRQ